MVERKIDGIERTGSFKQNEDGVKLEKIEDGIRNVGRGR
jgi:hypothetical protein